MVQKVIWLNSNLICENLSFIYWMKLPLSFWYAVSKSSAMSADGIAPVNMPAKLSVRKRYF